MLDSVLDVKLYSAERNKKNTVLRHFGRLKFMATAKKNKSE